MSTFPQHKMDLWPLRYEDMLIEATRARLAAHVSQELLINDEKQRTSSTHRFTGTLCWLRRLAVRTAGLASKASPSRRLANV